MCEGMAMLPSMMKNKAVPLRCTVDHNCWCNGLKKRLSHDFLGEGCLSPSDLLKSPSACFCAEDLAYLKSLAGREFIGMDE